jgi:sucrose-6F-phosphate phosphohydrolase
MNDNGKMKDWLFVSDIDDTLLGDESGLIDLADALKPVRDRMILVYNSSRPCASQRKSLAEHDSLPEPDYLIGALGTEIQAMDSGADFSAYSSQFANHWQRDQVAKLVSDLGFIAHDNEYQTPLKASYHAPGRSRYLFVQEQLQRARLNVRVIFSGDKNLDIIPKGADKGAAADFLRRRLGFEADQVIVAGDSANDRDMFQHGFKGIVVANADERMKSLSGSRVYHARSGHAGGVIEGLRHWGVIAPSS